MWRQETFKLMYIIWSQSAKSLLRNNKIKFASRKYCFHNGVSLNLTSRFRSLSLSLSFKSIFHCLVFFTMYDDSNKGAMLCVHLFSYFRLLNGKSCSLKGFLANIKVLDCKVNILSPIIYITLSFYSSITT